MSAKSFLTWIYLFHIVLLKRVPLTWPPKKGHGEVHHLQKEHYHSCCCTIIKMPASRMDKFKSYQRSLCIKVLYDPMWWRKEKFDLIWSDRVPFCWGWHILESACDTSLNCHDDIKVCSNNIQYQFYISYPKSQITVIIVRKNIIQYLQCFCLHCHCVVSGVAICWYILILLASNFPGCPGPSTSKLSLSRPLEREEGGARSRTQNRGEEEEIIMAMTKTKSGIRSQVSKNLSGKLDYFCSHTVFLEVAAVSVSQQGDLLLGQQFGLGHNITKLRRNYPALIGLTRPFSNN